MPEARDGLLPVEQVDRDAEELRAIATNIEVGRREPDTHVRLIAIADRLRAAPPLPPAMGEVDRYLNRSLQGGVELPPEIVEAIHQALPTPATGMGDAERAREVDDEVTRLHAYYVRSAAYEEAARVALEQRCERDTPWDRACTTIAAAIRELATREQGE